MHIQSDEEYEDECRREDMQRLTDDCDRAILGCARALRDHYDTIDSLLSVEIDALIRDADDDEADQMQAVRDELRAAMDEWTTASDRMASACGMDQGDSLAMGRPL